MRIDGKQIANKILEDLKERVEKLKKKSIVPQLAIILVGKDPASVAYVNQKKIKGERIDAKINIINLPKDTKETKILETIEQLNNDNNIHGIIVQQPLPKHISKNVYLSINPNKDVDGFLPNSKFEPPIALAVLRILKEIYWEKFEIRNSKSETNSNDQYTNFQKKQLFEHSNLIKRLLSQQIVILGKGQTGGKPIINALTKIGLSVITIDSKTLNPQNIMQNADIIISAVGKPSMITSDLIKKNVILIGVGMHLEQDEKLHGDYESVKIKDKTSFYTPTPGGVGPVNVAMLLQNLIASSENF